jgi:two-component system NtrC family response regulator
MNDKVLIVDDCEIVAEVFKDAFSLINIDAVKCKSAAAAMKEIEMNVYSAALIDVNLPDGNGLDVLKALKARNHFSMGYAFTGAPTFHELSEFINHGTVDFFVKSQMNVKEITESVLIGFKRQEKWRNIFEEPYTELRLDQESI